MNLSPDFKDFLRAFADADVRYLLVGGYAVSFHAQALEDLRLLEAMAGLQKP